jgi:hypothetical protein
MNRRQRWRVGISVTLLAGMIGCGAPKPEVSSAYQQLTPAERQQRNQERWAKRGIRSNSMSRSPASSVPAGQ